MISQRLSSFPATDANSVGQNAHPLPPFAPPYPKNRRPPVKSYGWPTACEAPPGFASDRPWRIRDRKGRKGWGPGLGPGAGLGGV